MSNAGSSQHGSRVTLTVYAYVKFLEGPLVNKKLTVDGSTIIHDFGVNLEFNPKKKYYIIHDGLKYKVQIIFVARTKVILEEKINSVKRKSIIPKLQLQTESEDENIQRSKTCSDNIENKESNLKKYLSLVVTKLESNKLDIDKSSNQTTDLVTQESISKSTISNRGSPESINKDKAQDSIPKNTISNRGSPESINKDKSFDTIEVLNNNKKSINQTQNERSNNDKKASAKASIKIDKNVNTKEDKCSLKNQDAEGLKENIQKASNKLKPKILHVRDVNKITKDYDKKCREVTDLEGKLKLLKAENKNLLKNTSSLNDKVRKLKKELTESENLNKDLQKKVIEQFKELKDVQTQVQVGQPSTSTADMDPKSNFVPIGRFRNSDNTYHIGRDTWLTGGVYDEIMKPHNKPAQCVGLIIKAVFGEKILIQSTITGRESNRKKTFKNIKENHSDTDDEETEKKSVEKLDGTKLAMCLDLYVHWLKFHHEKVRPDVKILLEIHNFNTYVSKKISYLKRPAQKRKNKKHDDQSESDDCAPPTKIKVTNEKKLKLQLKQENKKIGESNEKTDDETEVEIEEGEKEIKQGEKEIILNEEEKEKESEKVNKGNGEENNKDSVKDNMEFQDMDLLSEISSNNGTDATSLTDEFDSADDPLKV